MTKKEMFKELEMVREKVYTLDENAKIDVTVYDEITEKNTQDEIKKALSQAKKDLKTLEKEIDVDIEKALEKDGKKAVFKWVSIKDFYKMKLQTVTFEKIKVGYKISFRLDSKKIDLIKNAFCYCDGKDTELTAIDFENGQDVCTVEKIDKKKKSIFVKSDNYGGLWELSPIDFDGKYDKCVIKNGSNIAFLVYAPIEK